MIVVCAETPVRACDVPLAFEQSVGTSALLYYSISEK